MQLEENCRTVVRTPSVPHAESFLYSDERSVMLKGKDNGHAKCKDKVHNIRKDKGLKVYNLHFNDSDIPS